MKTIQYYMDREVSDDRVGILADPCPGWFLHLLKLDYTKIFASEEVKAMKARHAKNLEKAKREQWKCLFPSRHKKTGISRRALYDCKVSPP